MLMHFAELDQLVPQAARDEIAKAFADRSDVIMHLYPNADHAFSTVARASYHPEAAALARERSVEFLRETLGE